MTTPPNDTPEAADRVARLDALPNDLARAIEDQSRSTSTTPILWVAEECARLREENEALGWQLESTARSLALAAGLPPDAPPEHTVAEVCRILSSRPARDHAHLHPPSVAGPASPLPTKEDTPGDGGKAWPEIHGPARVVLGEVRELASTIAGLTQRVEDLELWRRVYVQGVGERLEDLEKAAEETAGAVLTVDERLPGGPDASSDPLAHRDGHPC